MISILSQVEAEKLVIPQIKKIVLNRMKIVQTFLKKIEKVQNVETGWKKKPQEFFESFP